jgi:hypothetical protein
VSERLSEKVRYARAKASYHLEQIQRLFVPGSKVTLLVRPPTGVESEFLLTDDNLDDVTLAIERSKQREDS